MRWGLIGASTIASEFMLAAIRSHQGNTITALLSGDVARGSAYAKHHHIPRATDDLAGFLAAPDLDAVYISSTNEKHHGQALAAIGAGKHVLCEKPLAVTLADAAEMVRAARDRGVVFATNHHLRCAGSHRAIRDLVRAGRIGEVLSVRVFHAVQLPPHLQGWRITDPAAGGGVIVDITVHDADTVRFLLDADPVEVVARAAQSGMGQGVEDSAMSIWTMPSGAMVQAHDSFTHPFASSGIELHGTKGSIHAQGVMTQRPVGSITLTDADGVHKVEFDRRGLYETAIEAFENAVAQNGRPAADGVDGIKSLAVALAVREAANTGRLVAVDYSMVPQ